ncbi:hypothetical protein BU17DRAFT_79149 [Hysterangium stoloniferum]|nr:hypothetical protein BU17DRAFT_79149 [Hysterangium stoloniferum]
MSLATFAPPQLPPLSTLQPPVSSPLPITPTITSANYKLAEAGYLPAVSAVLKTLGNVSQALSPISGLTVIFMVDRIVDTITQTKSNTEEVNRLVRRVTKLAPFFKGLSETSVYTIGGANDERDTDIDGCIRALNEIEKSLQRIKWAKTYKKYFHAYDNQATLRELSSNLDQELVMLRIKMAFKMGAVVDRIDAELHLISKEGYKKSHASEFQSSRMKVERKQASNLNSFHERDVIVSATNVDGRSSNSGFSNRISNLNLTDNNTLVDDLSQGTSSLIDETDGYMPYPDPVPQGFTINFQNVHFKTTSPFSPIQININSSGAVQSQYEPKLHIQVPRNTYPFSPMHSLGLYSTGQVCTPKYVSVILRKEVPPVSLSNSMTQSNRQPASAGLEIVVSP